MTSITTTRTTTVAYDDEGRMAREIVVTTEASADSAANLAVLQRVRNLLAEYDTPIPKAIPPVALRRALDPGLVKDCRCDELGADQREHFDGVCIPRYVVGS